MSKFLTIAEISKQTKIPESNLRYYRDKYIDYINPHSVGSGRAKRYKESAIPVFLRVAELVAEGVNATNVAESLDLEFTSEIVITQDHNQKKATTLKQHDIVHFLNQISEQKNAIDNLYKNQLQIQEQINQQQKFIEESIIKRDQQIMQLLRAKTEKVEEKNSRHWWQFWK